MKNLLVATFLIFIPHLAWAQTSKRKCAVEIIRHIASDEVYYEAIIIYPDKENPELVTFKEGKAMETVYYEAYKKGTGLNLSAGKVLAPDAESYQRYWKPVAEKTKNYDIVYVSNDGIYNLINLYTLYDPVAQKYLVDKPQDIIYMGNLKDIGTKKIEMPANPTAVLLGGIAYKTTTKDLPQSPKSDLTRSFSLDYLLKDGEIEALPESKKEVEEIEYLLKNRKIAVATYTGKDANEDLVANQKNPTILHIATHGFFIDSAQVAKDSPYVRKIYEDYPLLRCGLLLAGCEPLIKDVNLRSTFLEQNLPDNIFTAQEATILSLDKTQLVVLSACKTTLGSQAVGEGIYNLQRAFQQAGAKCVITSLWNVSDDASRKLMEKFYEVFLDTSANNPHQLKASALKKAQQETKIIFAEPCKWGGFVMMGE